MKEARIVFALLFAFVAASVTAETETVNGIKWTYYLQGNKAYIGTGSWYVAAIPETTEGAIMIPTSLGGHTVVAIECGAFYRCAKLTSVTIPISVASLGTQAFYHCDKLTALIFSGDEPSVGYTCFTYSPDIVMYYHAEKKWTGVISGQWNGHSAVALKGEELVAWDKCRFRIPHSWVDLCPSALLSANGDYAVALRSQGANSCSLIESYVAGLDPNDPASKFQVRLEITNGVPAVSWLPKLDDDETAKRIYMIYGRKSLSDSDKWTPIAADECNEYKFFQVCVSMQPTTK